MSFADLKYRKQEKSGKSYVSSVQSVLPESPVPTSTVSPQATTCTYPQASLPAVFSDVNVPVSSGNAFARVPRTEPVGLVTPPQETTGMGVPATTSDRTTGTPSHEGANTPVTYESGMYKNLPSFLEIKQSGQSGRGLWSKDSSVIRPGECNVPVFSLITDGYTGTTVLSLRPYVFSLSTSYLTSYCSACAGSPDSGLKRCTKCRQVWYCNPVSTSNISFHHIGPGLETK